MKKYKVLSALLAASLIIQTLPVAEVFAAPGTDAESTDEESTASYSDEASDTIEMENIEINTVEDFLVFAENCHLDSWSANKIITLKADIDLSATSFETIPVFAGIFDGGGHAISGFRPTEQGYIVGLFRYIEEGGIVRNMSLKGRIDTSNEQECVGSICGINYGTIRNCTFEGVVSGQNTVGGIAGINEASGSITNCLSNGHISGYYSTGGVVGINHGIITFCNNQSDINSDSAWVVEDDEMSSGALFSLQSSDDEPTLFSGVDAGGIAGYSNGLIERCNNYGTVGYEHSGYNIGGIAGRQAGIVQLCTNNGDVYGRKDIGGIVGQMEPDIEIDEAQSLRNAVNELHDLIEKTLDDMHDGKDTLKSDLDNLSMYGDGALSSGDALVGQMTDFVDDNIGQAQAIADRMDYIMDMLPDIMDDIEASGDAFSRLTGVTNQLMKDLNFMDRVDDSAYDETDYRRISLLSTVGGRLFVSQPNPDAGERVTVTVIPDAGYTLLPPISVIDADGDEVSFTRSGGEDASTNAEYAFTMPSENVKVIAYFEYKDVSSANFSAYVETEDEASPKPGASAPLEEDEEESPDESDEDIDNPSKKDKDNFPEDDKEKHPTGPDEEDADGSDHGDKNNPDEDDADSSDEEDDGDSFGDDADGFPENGADVPGEEDGVNGGIVFLPSVGSSSASSQSDEEVYAENVPKIILHSNLSGNASYKISGSEVTLTVRPDSGYTLSGTPVVTSSDGKSLTVTRIQSGSYQYTFSIGGIDTSASVRVEISFLKQSKSSAVDTSAGNIQSSILDLEESSEFVNGCLQRINELMDGRTWAEVVKDNDGSADKVIAEVVNMTNHLGQMSTSASSVLSSLSTLSNVLAPYIQDSIDDALDDIDEATNEVQNIINSIRDATRNVRGIVTYVNAQPDIQFSTLGSEFDANREDLHYQLVGISDSLKSLSNNASELSDVVNEDLKAVNDQLNVVFNLLADHLTDAVGFSVGELYQEVDIEDIDSIVTGRVDSCINNGVVRGDINIGGIAGSMSIDEEDPEDNAAGSVDYQIGRRFITKCIIVESTNNGYVTAKKDGAGGVVGYMKHGIVSNCEGYGNVESTEGDYVGGIAGQSLTVVRNSYALCSVSGGKNIGGVAGYASTVQGCYAIVSADASIGKMGAIAGQAASETNENITDNYYVGDDIYGIDNISYAGVAEPISYNDLLTVENLPTAFWHLKVTYRIDDTYLGTQEVKYGASLANLNYPEIPAKEGYYGVWPDLSDQVMTCNLLIDGEYVDTVTVVESSEKSGEYAGDWQKPYALVERVFTEDTVLNVVLSNQTPPKEADGRDYVIYDISLENGNISDTETFAIRLLNPYGDGAAVWGLLNGHWTELDSLSRGQYLQVEMTGPREVFCIVDDINFTPLIIVLCIVFVVVLALIIFLVKRLKRKVAGLTTKKQSNP